MEYEVGGVTPKVFWSKVGSLKVGSAGSTTGWTKASGLETSKESSLSIVDSGLAVKDDSGVSYEVGGPYSESLAAALGFPVPKGE